MWLTISDGAASGSAPGRFLNIGVMVRRSSLVEIGDHCMFANGCFVTDANHRFDDPDKPITWQGFTTKGPTRVGDNVWCGANVVITSGVTVGERCVIGANSVVTEDIPPFSIAAGAPAKVLRRVEYPPEEEAQQRTSRWNVGLGRRPGWRYRPLSVRTSTPLTFDASEPPDLGVLRAEPPPWGRRRWRSRRSRARRG